MQPQDSGHRGEGTLLRLGHAEVKATSNPPLASFNGEDAQLNAAVNYLEKEIRENPIPELKAKPIPPIGETGKDIE